jgi:cytochrome b561
MPLVNTRLRYGTVAMTLHWLIAAAILFNLCLGFYVAQIMSDDDPSHFRYVQLHKSVGLTILVLSVLRLLWRIVNPVPPLPDTLTPALKVVARGTHYLLYFLIIAIPLTGWALVSSSPLGLPTSYFGLFHWPHISFLADLPLVQKRVLGHEFLTVHMYLAISAIALLALHVAGALYHQRQGDNVVRRMLPGARLAGEK